LTGKDATLEATGQTFAEVEAERNEGVASEIEPARRRSRVRKEGRR